MYSGVQHLRSCRSLQLMVEDETNVEFCGVSLRYVFI